MVVLLVHEAENLFVVCAIPSAATAGIATRSHSDTVNTMQLPLTATCIVSNSLVINGINMELMHCSVREIDSPYQPFA